MNNFSTHTIRKYPSKNTTLLFRNRDGMVIGGVGPDSCVNFGEDPHDPQSRQFISHSHAVAFLRKIADTDQKEWMISQGHDPDPTYAAHIEEDSDTNLTVVRTN